LGGVALPVDPSVYWTLRLSRWRPIQATPTAGYTLLVPVPGDIPAFLELALRVLALQDATERVETIVIPDRVTPTIEAIVERAAARWEGPLRLCTLPSPERWFLPLMKSGSRNHGMQVVEGINQSRATHVCLHDADLFLLDRTLLDAQYRRCRDENLACVSVSPAWDQWYREHGLELGATWEMFASNEWLRSFPPHRHIGHDAELFGERHTFDTTFYAQCLTAPQRVRVVDREGDLVHFNYTISTFRAYQRTKEAYEDRYFRLLLIRLFIDLFGELSVANPGLPDLSVLRLGLDDGSASVTYPSEAVGGADYREFRATLERALQGDYLDPALRRAAAAALEPFDAHYAYPGVPAV